LHWNNFAHSARAQQVTSALASPRTTICTRST
jgi:hypothetical protein